MLRGKINTKFFRRTNATLIGAFASLLLIGFSGAGVAAAATASTSPATGSPNGFSISPVETPVTINRGQAYTLTIYLQNPTSSTVEAQAVVDNFTASTNESGTPNIILNNNAPAPANDFRKLVGSIPEVSIGPNQQKTITISLSVPSNANPGGYYGAIRFVPIIGSQKSSVGLTASVGTLVLVTVPGNLVENLSLVQLSAAQNGNTGSFFMSGGGSLSVITRLKNTGNIYFAPFGTLQIFNMSNKAIASYEFNSAKGNILPDSIRRYTNTLPKNYHWFGRYKIVANIGYGSSGGLLSETATFWYIPTWFVILAIIVIIVIVALIYWLARAINKRRIRKSHRR